MMNKSNYTEENKKFMKRAIDLAEKGMDANAGKN